VRPSTSGADLAEYRLHREPKPPPGGQGQITHL
jgi:hypothetical protein